MSVVQMPLQPARIPEWEAERDFASLLGDTPDQASAAPTDDETRRVLAGVTIELPGDIEQRFLSEFDAAQPTPLDQSLLPDCAKYDYYLVEVPVTVAVPAGPPLGWLRLTLDLKSPLPPPPTPILPYNLYPTTEWNEKDRDLGEVGLDAAKVLAALIPGLPAISDALSLKIKFPLRWHSRKAMITSTNRLFNPARWIVKDEAIQNGFNAYMVVRSPRGVSVLMEASLAAVFGKGRSAIQSATSHHQYALSRGQ